jgi:molecular chaperone GrpE
MATHPQEPEHPRATDSRAEVRDTPAPVPSEPVPPPGATPSEPVPRPAEEATGPPADDETGAALAELEDRWRRALADLDNLRKRHARELERERAAERARTAAALLPVVDNLELALAHGGSDPQSVLEGVRAVHAQAVTILDRLGYRRHAETGVPFDPGRHEVVSVVDAPGAEPGTVVQVVRPGYGEGDRLLRPASVTVGKQE